MGCSKTKNDEKEEQVPIWLFTENSTKQEVEAILKNKHIFSHENDTIINNETLTYFLNIDHNLIEYLGIKWDSYLIGFVNDSIKAVVLTTSPLDETLNPKTVPSGIDELTNKLDNLYGSHQFKDLGTTNNIREYEWKKENVNIKLNISDVVSKNDMLGLEFTTMDSNELADKFQFISITEL